MDACGALLALTIQQPRERESTREITDEKENKGAVNREKKFKKRKRAEINEGYYNPRLKSRLNNTIIVK